MWFSFGRNKTTLHHCRLWQTEGSLSMYMYSNNKETEKPAYLRADNMFVIIWLWDKDSIPLGGMRSFTSLEQRHSLCCHLYTLAQTWSFLLSIHKLRQFHWRLSVIKIYFLNVWITLIFTPESISRRQVTNSHKHWSKKSIYININDETNNNKQAVVHHMLFPKLELPVTSEAPSLLGISSNSNGKQHLTKCILDWYF